MTRTGLPPPKKVGNDAPAPLRGLQKRVAAARGSTGGVRQVPLDQHSRRRSVLLRVVVEPRPVNGEPGVAFTSGGAVIQVVSLRIEGGVRAVYMTLNPDKLSRWSVAEVE